jgi:hypothetical protein
MKKGVNLRRKEALKRLEATYASFKEEGKDKDSHESTRNGRKIFHSGRSFEDECNRLSSEIAILKRKIK